MGFYYKLKVSTSNIKSFLFIDNFFKKKNLDLKVAFLPTKQKRFVLLKSPHVNKKSKEHFQFLKYQRIYTIPSSLTNFIDTFLLTAPNDLSITIKKLITK